MAPFLASLALLALHAADPAPASLEQLRCPASEANMVCQAEAGPNWAFLYAYPAEIRAIPMLYLSFRRGQSLAWGRYQATIATARATPQQLYTREEVYTIDADRPELLALTFRQVQHNGGAETVWGVGSLIWDRRNGTMLNFEELFEDLDAAKILINAQFCAALRQARDTALGGTPHQDCPDLYFARLVAGPDGRVGRLHFSFDPMDGPDDGQFEVEVPVTEALIQALQRPFRPAFVASSGAVTTCRRASAGAPCA